MALLNWQNNYSVGVKVLDDQHKKMFDLINGLHESMKELKDKKVMDSLLKELDEYGKMHLSTEEKYFNEFNFSDKQKHTEIHEVYRNKIREFIDKKDDTILSFEIIDFLEDWWLGHIVSEDQNYVDCFKANGLS